MKLLQDFSISAVIAGFVTFLMTASSVTLFGIDSAFWGLVAGLLSLFLLQISHSSSYPITK